MLPREFTGLGVPLFFRGGFGIKYFSSFVPSPPCILLFILIAGLMNCDCLVAGEVSCFTQAEGALKEAFVSGLAWRAEGS